jgi:hypothetical protein
LGATDPGAAASPFSIDSVKGGELSSDSVNVPDGTPYGSNQVGTTRFSNIVLKRGMVDDDPLSSLVSNMLQGKVQPISGGCAEGKKGLNAVNVKLAFVQAVPTSVRFPALDPDSNKQALMAVTLTPGAVKFSQATAGSLGVTKVAPGRSYTAGRFAFAIDGVGFPSVTHVNPFEVDCSTAPDGSVQLRASDLVIKADALTAGPLYTWANTVSTSKVDRRSISVIFHNDAGEEVSRLNFFECWPRSITTPLVSALTGEVTVTLSVGSAAFTIG